VTSNTNPFSREYNLNSAINKSSHTINAGQFNTNSDVNDDPYSGVYKHWQVTYTCGLPNTPASQNINARYIYLRRIKNNPFSTVSSPQNNINLRQIEIYDNQGRKYTPSSGQSNTVVLPNMTASLSAVYDNNNTYAGDKLISGNINNLAATTVLPLGNFNELGTGISSSILVQYALVDLGVDMTIGRIVIYNRIDCCQDRIL
jgi:hypothetical protein